MSNSSSEDAIIEKILEDAQKQARRILDGANRTAEGHRKRAEAEAEKIKQDIINHAKAKAEMFRAKEIATARLQAKRIFLDAREAVIKKAFAMIEEGLKGLRKSSKYRDVLLKLAREAIVAVGQNHVSLVFSKEDEGLVDETFVEELKRDLGGQSEESSRKMDIRFDPDLRDGGCVGMSSDSRIVFDNTFGRRFERFKPELRSMLIERLSRKDG